MVAGYYLVSMSPAPIPEEQRARLQPAVDDLLTKLRSLAAKLPEDSESALVFQVAEEGE